MGKTRHEPYTHSEILRIASSLDTGKYCGAHVGDTGLFIACALKGQNSKAKVWMIEPDNDKVKFISSMIKHNNLDEFCIITNAALGSQKSRGSLKNQRHPGGGGLLIWLQMVILI
jgi:hypothetical protein